MTTRRAAKQTTPETPNPSIVNFDVPASAVATLVNAVQNNTPVVTPKRAAQPNEDSSKKAPKKEPCYFSFELINGKPDVNFETKEEANDFKQEYGDLIDKEHKFTSGARFKSHVAKRNDPLLNPVSDTLQASSPFAIIGNDEDGAARQLCQSLESTLPVDRIHIYFKTTPNSTIVCYLIQVLTKYESSLWCWKPEWMTPYVAKVPDSSNIADLTVVEAFQNMISGRAVDPASTDKNKPLIVSYKPKGTDTVKSFEEYVAYTYVHLPYTSLKNADDEETWIRTNGHKIGESLRSLFLSTFWKSILSQTGRNSFFEKCYDPELKVTIPKFMAKATVRVQHCAHFTDHVIKAVSNDIMSALYESRLPAPKYKDQITISAAGITE